jgi:hypothetical protein
MTDEEGAALAAYCTELEERIAYLENELAYQAAKHRSIEAAIERAHEPREYPSQEDAYVMIWGKDKYRRTWGREYTGDKYGPNDVFDVLTRFG